jgi:hypothetical protein
MVNDSDRGVWCGCSASSSLVLSGGNGPTMELLCSGSLMADALRWRSGPSVGGDTHVM